MNTEEMNSELDVQNTELEEAAADTLKPGAGSGGTESKAQMLSTFVSLMSKLGKEDLSKFFNDSIAQIGHEADKIPDGAAAKNKASINAKTVKEDLDELFSVEEGEETLSEEFKEKASTIFEATINTAIEIETARLEEEFEERFNTASEELEEAFEKYSEEMFEALENALDTYLEYAATTYIEENAMAIEQGIRTDLAENFLHGLQNLFAEHYITVPENKVDILGEMKAEIDMLKDKLNETTNENLELKTAIVEAEKEIIFSEVTEGLVDTNREKLRILSEGLEYTDSDTFKKKLEIVKESYLNKKTTPTSTGILTETIDGEVEETETPLAGNMAKYVSAVKATK